MLSQFNANYQRMEQSLQRLTDSIAAYNPSTAAADELVAADEAVNENLEQLIEHQRNYQRIQELKRTTQSLDDTLKGTIRQLAERRKELIEISSPAEELTPGREITVHELLAYANFISPTTVPPTFRKQDAPPKPVKSEQADTQMANGIATPGSATQEESNNAAFIKSEDVLGKKVLSERDQAWLNPQRHLAWEPWPSHDVVQRGALADVQRIVESGRDPASVLSAEEMAEVERKRVEEEAAKAREEEERDRRRMSIYGGGVRRRGTVEQVDVFDPDA